MEKMNRIAYDILHDYFSEKDLLETAINYVEYKFRVEGSFAKLAAIHYDLFRQEKKEGEKERIMTIAELMLLALDIMDDMQDGDGQEHPWGQADDAKNLNILIGFLMICLAEVNNLLLDEQMKNDMMQTIHTNILRAINGQAADLKNELLTEEECLDMVSMKSGSLIKMVCLLGAGQVDPVIKEGISSYADYLGIVEQIRNDVNDLLHPECKNDVPDKKRTLPILFYLNNLDPKYEPVKEYYKSNKNYEHMAEQEKKELRTLLVQGGALSYCSVMEQLYLYKFRECVNRLPIEGDAKNQLIGDLA